MPYIVGETFDHEMTYSKLVQCLANRSFISATRRVYKEGLVHTHHLTCHFAEPILVRTCLTWDAIKLATDAPLWCINPKDPEAIRLTDTEIKELLTEKREEDKVNYDNPGEHYPSLVYIKRHEKAVEMAKRNARTYI